MNAKEITGWQIIKQSIMPPMQQEIKNTNNEHKVIVTTLNNLFISKDIIFATLVLVILIIFKISRSYLYIIVRIIYNSIIKIINNII